MTNFDAFIAKFPEVKLPLSITEDSASAFGLENEPLSERQILEHILPIEGETELDEMTEYVPCFRIAGLKDIHAIVYWKAGLMIYQYVLATFGMGGKLIDRQVIAGTFSDGKTLTRSVARLDDDFSIYIVSGQIEGSGDEIYDATASTARELELLPDGRIFEFA